jgi:hypothetical protein
MINPEYEIRDSNEYVPDFNDINTDFHKNVEIVPNEDGQSVTIFNDGDEVVTLVFGEGLNIRTENNVIYIELDDNNITELNGSQDYVYISD